MNVAADYDVAIVGGGLAGLSLAVRLAEPRFRHLRVLVLEARTDYVRDRTWCFWQSGPHPFEAAVSRRWDRWAVAGHGVRVERSVAGVGYACIRADHFYELALARIDAAPNVELQRGIAAEAIETTDGVVLAPSGLRARLAFDARPPKRLGQHGLAQRFLGQEVEVERPIFDPGCALLMDLEASPHGVHFTYVLPMTRTRALVEDAWFASPGMVPPDHRSALDRWLDGQAAGERRVLFEESGCLPMDPHFRPDTGRRLLPLGGAAAAHRPATGYAFASVQAQCDFVVAHLEAALAAGRMQAMQRRPVSMRGMDNAMLAFLARWPLLAPRLFTALFSHCSADRLVRFLADRPSRLDLAAVALAGLRGLGAAVR